MEMKKYFWRIAIVVIAIFLGVGVYEGYQVRETINNSYAVWWVANMTVEHMKANENSWPRNWDDLEDDYQTCVSRSGDPWSFEELSRRVIIDWDANPTKLLEEPGLRVIWLADGTSSHWKSAEPNEIVASYLKSQTNSSMDRNPIDLDAIAP